MCFSHEACSSVYSAGKQNCSIVHEEKKWREAQIHCREKNRDLISGIKQLEEFTVTESQKKKMWIGLFRDKWRWSSGNRFNFRNWESDQDETEGEKCASIQLTGLKKWKSADCGETKPFFCYDGEFFKDLELHFLRAAETV